MKLEFDPVNHVYAYQGKVIPSVTQLIPKLDEFNYVRDEVLDQAKSEGKKNHFAIEVSIRNKKPVNEFAQSFFDLIKNYAILKNFPDVMYSEERLFDDVLLFAGTPDLVLCNHDKKTYCIIDLKRSISAYPYKHELQLAGYNILIKLHNKEYKCEDKFIIAGKEKCEKILRLNDKFAEAYFTMLVKQYYNNINLESYMRNYK